MSPFLKSSVILFLLASCGPQATQIYTTYESDEFGFTVTIPDDLGRVGWGIVDAEDATIVHAFTPPDTSSWEAIAVVVPPGSLFPLLAPIFIDIFNVKDPTLSSVELADLKADRVEDRLLSRKTLTGADGLELAQLVHGSGDNINYETYAVGNGFGYAFLAQGAPNTSTSAPFRVDSNAYDRIVSSLRLTTPR